MKRDWVMVLVGLILAVASDVGAADFDRDSVSNLVLWLKADEGVSTNASGGVTTWSDQSASNNTATGSGCALHLNVVNGRPAVWFNGAGNFASFAAAPGQIRTVFWVVNEYASATTAYRPLLGHSTLYPFHRGDSKCIWRSTSTSESIRNGTTYVNGVAVNGVATTVPTSLAIVALVTTGNVSATEFGRDRTFNDRGWHGYLAELLIFSHALTSNELQTVGYYLADKYGIQAYVPEGAEVRVNATAGVSQVTVSSATVNGTLVSTGDAPTEVTLFWGAHNGGTSTGGWEHAQLLGVLPEGPVSSPLTDLSEDTLYYYVFRATNASYTAWSEVRSFRTLVGAEPGTRRMKVRFKGYTRGEPLVNFPVLIVFSNGWEGFDYADFRSPPWHDLRFMTTHRQSLHYEVEQWDTGGVSFVWVQLPVLSDTNDFIYAYWGQLGRARPDYTTNGLTWSEGFGGVWHFAETVTHGGKQNDSSMYGNSATFYDANGSSAAGTNGPVVGPATRLSGDADYYEVTNRSGIFASHAVTCEIWGRSEGVTWSDYGTLLSKRNQYMLHPQIATRQVTFAVWNPSSSSRTVVPDDITVWHYYAGTYDMDAQRIFLDGIPVSTNVGGLSLFPDTAPLCLGHDNGYPGARFLNGWIDEARVSLTARSTNWIWATWRCIAANGDFVEYGPVENRAMGILVQVL